MRQRFGWLPAGAAVMVALAAPVAVAQEKTPTAEGSRGAAASVDPLATQAAIDVMADGGNAFDAAIAAAGVLGVVEPYSCGIGGGGFMVFRDGETGKISTLDSREKSPGAMVPSSFFIDGRAPTDAQFAINRYSGLSAGVPGTPYAWSHILRNYGTIKLSEALSYGAKVAREGFTVDQTFVNQTTPNVPYFDDIPSTAALFLDPDGTAKDVGAVLRNPALARTYERMGRLGVTKGFYTGPVADAMVKAATQPPVAATADHAWRPGLLSNRDLERYQTKTREAVKLSLPRPRHLRHGPAVLRRDDDRRDAQHPAGLQPPRRRPQGPHRHDLPLPRGVTAGLRRPQPLHRRPVVRLEPGRGPALGRLRRHARRADPPDARPPAPSPRARRPARPPPPPRPASSAWARRRT